MTRLRGDHESRVVRGSPKPVFPRVLALWLGVAVAASASSQTQAPQQLSSQAVRVVTNEVVVPVTVTDQSGRFVLTLSKDDFHVFDNDAEQTIDSWDMGGEPLAAVLVLETSSRLGAMAPEIHSLGIIFTETVMALDGEAAVITYDSTVDVRQTFTQDHDAIEQAVEATQFEAPERKLYDAMELGVEMLEAEPAKWRRILLIVGESRDDGSGAKLGAIVRGAAHQNIAIYAVGPGSAKIDFLRDAPTEWAAPAIWLLDEGKNKVKGHELSVATAATGGVHYTAVRAATMSKALDEIGGELHTQYIVSYRPTSNAPGFHSIRVTVSPSHLVVRARPGYYVAPPEKEE